MLPNPASAETLASAVKSVRAKQGNLDYCRLQGVYGLDVAVNWNGAYRYLMETVEWPPASAQI